MAEPLEHILKKIPAYREAMAAHRELLLANALLFGEIPAPTFEEEARIRFLSDRFIESGLENISIDEEGNGLALLPGTKGKRNILVFAHADTVFNSKADHAMSVGPDRITGPGIGDNSLGLATVATLPVLLNRLGVRLRDNLILMGSVKSLGHGDLGGLRFFLEHNKRPLRAGVCVEGIHLGRLSYASIGMLRGEIDLTVPPEYDWTNFGASGAVAILTKVVRRIMEIPIPMEPKTRILLGSMNAGTAFGTQPTMANLKFEVRSEDESEVTRIRSTIEDIIEEIASGSRTEIQLSVIAQRRPGGLAYAHPLVRTMREILKSLTIEPYVAPSVGEISELIQRSIPAVTLGLTDGEGKNEFTESIEIEPLFGGLAQLIALLESIDGGLCDE